MKKMGTLLVCIVSARMNDMYICTIKVDPLLQEKRIILSSALFRKFRLSPQLYMVKLGQKQVKVTLELGKQRTVSDQLWISEALASSLRVPKNDIKLHLSVDQEEATLYLGPIFMILTDASAKDLTSPFFIFCKEVAEAGFTKGIFTALKINDSTDGYLLINGEWQKQSSLPEPDVIYNRIHSRVYENTSSFKKMKEQWPHAYMFNHHFLNKWITHEMLFSDGDLRPHLPETYLLTNETLQSILDDYKNAYIKPINGSQGKGIYLIEATEQGYWVTPSFLDKKDPIWLATREHVSNLVKRLCERREYIVQQAIPLLTLDERLVDFRFLLHYYNQKWHVTSAVARVGEAEKIVSNQALGGEIFKPLQIVEDWFPEQHLQIFKNMIILSKKIAQSIQEKSDGLFCELGLDLAIDYTGEIWLLEVNSKPSKTEAVREDLTIRPSAKAICKSCLFLYKDIHDQKRR